MDHLGSRLERRKRLTLLRALTPLFATLGAVPFLLAAFGFWSLAREALWVALVLLSYAVTARILADQEADLRFLFDHPELIEWWKRRQADRRRSASP